MQALGSRTPRDGVELVLALLEKPGAVEELVARTRIASATASRRLDDLALVGIVRRSRPHGPYEVAFPEETRRFLEAASDLAIAALAGRLESEEQFRKVVRKSRVKPAPGDASTAT